MQPDVHSDASLPALSFPTDPTGLPEAGRPALVELGHGDVLDLRVGPVAKRLGDATVRMLGYNGSIPGPTLKVRQGSEVTYCLLGFVKDDAAYLADHITEYH